MLKTAEFAQQYIPYLSHMMGDVFFLQFHLDQKMDDVFLNCKNRLDQMMADVILNCKNRFDQMMTNVFLNCKNHLD